MSAGTGTRAPNPEQREAIEAAGPVFVSAGAGTGKTTVLVERFARAVCERGLDVSSVLVITYTERAAGELRERVRARLHEAGRPDLARELDGAWISTIHGFCLRLLKTHPFAAGLDPRFRVLDDNQARVIQAEAFERALAEFCAGADPERLRLLATYGARGLRRMLTGVHERLRSAGRDLVLVPVEPPALEPLADDLRAAAAAFLDGFGSEAAARALELLAESPPPERLLDLEELKAGRKGGEARGAYEAARTALAQAALDHVAARDRDLLQELLASFGRAYREAKEREAALDFEDLQLVARDLLSSDERIREAESWRFRSIMVDEFQDTNRLQCELVDLLAGDDADREVFFVGDEFQSIYRFRHADVEVFRERRAQSGGPLALTKNYRSRPEVLAVVNHLFAEDFGGEFQPLEAAGSFSPPASEAAVELLVTDKASYRETGIPWRVAEARHVAARLREIVDAGEASPGEIVLLFAAGTDAELYEEELRRAGLPTFRGTGRNYYGQQQVGDLLAYLRLLHNRYDDEALVTVLASPLVGVSNDALVLLRRSATGRPLFAGLERSLPPGLDGGDERLFQAFRQRYERLSAASGSLSLERLCEQIVAEHDYDLAVLAQWDGRRRYANLRKLARLARSYEELRGPDVEGFVRFVRDQGAVGAKELEAAAEEEGADVVRLLTIHAAKGLEFKVVVVADAGRDRAAPAADEILVLPDGRFGFKVADPATGRRKGALGWEDVRRVETQADEAERRRLYYVAMTRAIDRLVVSGAIDRDRAADAGTPIGWVLDRLDRSDLDAADGAPLVVETGGARVVVRVDRYTPSAAPLAPAAAEEGQLVLFPLADGAPVGPAVPAAFALPELPPVEPAPLHRPSCLSFSAISLYGRCGYRYYAERVVGMRPREPVAGGEGGLAATEVGDAVHVLLEGLDLRAPAAPAADELAGAVRARYPAATDAEVERIGGFVRSYCASPLAARVAALEGVEVERSFAFLAGGVVLRGRLDVLHRGADGRWLVADYKTNALGEADPVELVAAGYSLQRAVYALACLRAGAREVEVVYAFLERPDALVSATFTAADEPSLSTAVGEAVADVQSGSFRPTPGEWVCSDCPALDVVCAGPRLSGAFAR